MSSRAAAVTARPALFTGTCKAAPGFDAGRSGGAGGSRSPAIRSTGRTLPTDLAHQLS
jgi:hypothetical protein